MQKEITRGIRNNNPLNIRHSKGFTWLNEQLPDPDGFCRFSGMVYGLRAAFALLRTYNLRYNLYSVREIIERWAPPSENHTEIYIAYITNTTLLEVDTRCPYGSDEAKILIQAMAMYESRYLAPNDLLDAAQMKVKLNLR